MAGAFATCMQPMKAPSDILGSGVNCNTVLYRTRHAASSRVPKASTAQLRRQCASTPGCSCSSSPRSGRGDVAVHAQQDNYSGSDSDNDGPASEEEQRIARVEALTRSSKRKPAPRPPQPPGMRPLPPTPAKNRWREGQLFPDGWKEMGVLERGWQLWAGERGFQFWSAKLAFQACIGLVGGWILFRFVGPALGLYQLANSLSDAPVEF
mmetsp:Transcript_3934/g.11450  ORF Transcript_3934/g.11450 Transcript_3934/m.11450 type:complete len:209 (-) Transcript_3934:510-1136(-)|eukprot:CAMPEP_0206134738 /NCGR_PEP_ID=MMETSP1473-20131121/181_1 /ASSEMBLY_ACC=CAM_ASM_001109 /TAXON_ID=1461547 /ORGANISM="Stichococcus sp, Strain RCC1054" /LENGTH=208 /DNA_ID=CAMNT_0053526359 /DNA_START=110 /DNA_END=736 /DNA_ORIENTATION=+